MTKKKCFLPARTSSAIIITFLITIVFSSSSFAINEPLREQRPLSEIIAPVVDNSKAIADIQNDLMRESIARRKEVTTVNIYEMTTGERNVSNFSSREQANIYYDRTQREKENKISVLLDSAVNEYLRGNFRNVRALLGEVERLDPGNVEANVLYKKIKQKEDQGKAVSVVAPEVLSIRGQRMATNELEKETKQKQVIEQKRQEALVRKEAQKAEREKKRQEALARKEAKKAEREKKRQEALARKEAKKALQAKEQQEAKEAKTTYLKEAEVRREAKASNQKEQERIKKIELKMTEARQAHAEKRYDDAATLLNEVLIWEPKNRDALRLKKKAMKQKRKAVEEAEKKARQEKAERFRKGQYDEKTLLKEEEKQDAQLLNRIEVMREAERKKEALERERLAEEQIREDLHTTIEQEEKEYLDSVIKDVEKSNFYEEFKEYDKKKRTVERERDRQIRSFLLRAEGLMEMGKHEEALIYVSNVFAIDPYNEKAKQMRDELEEKIQRKKNRRQKQFDELFEKERKQYKKIRDKVRTEKVRELLQNAKMFYKNEDWLNARQEVQKALIVDPSHRGARRFLKKIDKKLLGMQEEIKAREEKTNERREGAMEEASQEAARVLELELIKEKKDTHAINKRVAKLKTKAEGLIRKKQYDEALVVLNKAFAIDPTDTNVVTTIKTVREEKEKARIEGSDNASKVYYDAKDSHKESVVSIYGEKESPEEIEQREKEYVRAQRILNSAARKSYRKKVETYVNNAEKYLEENQFDKAREEVKQIFLFDKNNPTAQNLLARITEFEVRYEKKVKARKYKEDAFEKGLELEKLKTVLHEETSDKDVIRTEEAAQEEDVHAKERAVKKLIKEGKQLFKEKRYYEALNKFEAIIALDENNKKALTYIDKVKDRMAEERKAEREEIKTEQKRETEERLDAFAKEIKELHSEGKFTKAAIVIEKALLIDPGNKYFLELKKFNKKGQREQMRRVVSPDQEINNLVNLAVKEYVQGNYIEAKAYFERVLELDPTDERAQNDIKKIEQKIKTLKIQE